MTRASPASTHLAGPSTPADLIKAWPVDQPLAVLTAGPWVLLASPSRATPIFDPRDLWYTKPAATAPPPPDAPPFRSGRALALAYHLGHRIEPAAGATPGTGPVGWAFDVPGVIGFNRQTGRWAAAGDAPTPPTTAPGPSVGRAAGFSVGPLQSNLGSVGYTRAVRQALDAIAAGDLYQVNIAHRLSAPFEGSPRAFFAALLASADPAHGAYLETPALEPDRLATAICSASPELFLRFDAASRRVTTRPMKGTRPISADPEELRHAAKDRAELDMITDLMRNDLGRVCRFGSVRVESAREIEAHAGSVWQATSTVSGVLRDGLSHADLLEATFPPGSVTGAPKIRAMRLIDELEPSPRGFYCGSIGWIDDSGDMELNVAIRTAQIEPGPDGRGELHYHAGAGIVADSDPDAEWLETMSKAGALSTFLGRSRTSERGDRDRTSADAE